MKVVLPVCGSADSELEILYAQRVHEGIYNPRTFWPLLRVLMQSRHTTRWF